MSDRSRRFRNGVVLVGQAGTAMVSDNVNTVIERVYTAMVNTDGGGTSRYREV